MYLLLSLLVIAAIFSARVSSKFGMPMLIAFLGIGMIVGSDGLALIEFNNAELARRVGDLLLIFIIFDGGFQTKRAIFKSVKGPALTLATFGVIVTAAVLGGMIHLITKLDLLTSMMIGSILSSTDAAAVIMATRQTPIRRNLATTLDVESAANDPMAILLTTTFIAAIKGQDGSGWLPLTLGLIWSFVAGVG
ncbi:MAG TPA: cation:proton antiporter, partial [Myxococcota bacterium]|nr:cation:proton antiporter [Myxococcota bacterium]